MAWFGLYLAIVTLPLALALLLRLQDGASHGLLTTGLGLATGVIAFSLMAAEFGLVARIKAASLPFGTDALMYFHRLMGIAGLAFLLAHPLLLVGAGNPLALFNPLEGTVAQRSGALAFWLALALVVLALTRRRLGISHEAWQRLHLGLAVAVIAGALVHFLPGLQARGDTLLALLLVSYAAMFLLLLLDYRLLRPWRLARRAWRLLENRDEGASTRTLVLEPVGHMGLDFQPGQFAWINTSGSAFGFHQHPITISSSAESTSRLEFAVKDLGDWSGVEVPGLQPGKPVQVDGPYGSFTVDRHPAEGFLLVAGGVGITPMRSMLLTLRDRKDVRPVILIHAAHDPSRAIFREELAALQRQMNLIVVPVYEVRPPDAQGEQGLVTIELLQRHLPAGIGRWQCFICGPGPMMTVVDSALRQLGLPASHIHAERFDMV